MPDSVSPSAVPPKVWSPFGIACLSLLLSSLTGGILHALNERRFGRERSWRATLYRNLFLGALLLLPALLHLTSGRGSLLAGNIFVASYFYKTQSDLFAQHLAAGGAKARFWIPILVTLAAASIPLVLAIAGF